MGHVGNPRSFRLTHQRVGRPLSGNLNSLLEHRLRYWGSQASLLGSQVAEPISKPAAKLTRPIKSFYRRFSGPFLKYLTKIRGRLLYDHPSWRQLWYPANYRGSYAHYYHMWKQSGDLVSRKSSLIRPTKRRMRTSSFGYYSHSYFLGKADGSFISKPAFVSRFLAYRDLVGYQFPSLTDVSKPVEDEQQLNDVSPLNEPLRRVVAQPAPGFVIDPYAYRTKRIMRKISTRFIYFFREPMIARLLAKEFKQVTPALLYRFRRRFSTLSPEFVSSSLRGGRRAHADFAVSRGESPGDRLKPVSRNHGLFDFFNFISFKTDSKSAIPNVGPISDIRAESLTHFPYERFGVLPLSHEEQLQTYVKELQRFCKAGIEKRKLESKTFAVGKEFTDKQLTEYVSARAEFTSSSRYLRKIVPKNLRSIIKLRRFQQRARVVRRFRALLRRVYPPKRVTVKKAKIRAKLSRQTVGASGPKRVKKPWPTPN